jgi:hypothetical protein
MGKYKEREITMGQQEVLDWLEQNPGWHKTKDICKGLKRRRTGGNFRLFRILRKTNEVYFRLLSGNGKGYTIYEYRHKSKSLNTKEANDDSV